MFKDIISAFKQFNHLKIKALSLGLATKTALEKDGIMRGLSKVQEAFPQLSDSTYDEKADVFKIGNDEQETDKQILLAVQKGSYMVFSWGIEFPFGTKEDMMNVFNGFQEGVSLLPINIAYTDFCLHAVSYWEGHHYALIWNTFFKESPIFSLFEPQSLLQDDLVFRAFLSEDSIVIVEIQSNVKDSEIRNESFENDMMTVRVGIAKTRHFDSRVELAQLIAQHIEISRPFIIDRFLPSVLVPLDAALAAITSETKEK